MLAQYPGGMQRAQQRLTEQLDELYKDSLSHAEMVVPPEELAAILYRIQERFEGMTQWNVGSLLNSTAPTVVQEAYDYYKTTRGPVGRKRTPPYEDFP